MKGYELFIAYRNDLSNYSLEQLRHIPEKGVWSIGQMYDHLIVVSHEYLDSMEACAGRMDEQTYGKTPAGEKLFQMGGFPAIKIRLPDEMNAPPNNSASQEELMNRIEEVILRLMQWELKSEAINPNFKVEHGGFGWLNAKEWYVLVEMHARHHLKQQEELESYL
ncbi:DinB family protein [Planomicrobium chinense]|uniref:DinB family protein n=1 Tax=Planococcus chinensis TaxID=272917 RepID=UPI001CC6AD83|nr:DinB family protein [Planococcus chinensis]MBZ5201750.1 DinB family protein [Planococcus chinensis]